MEPAVEATDLRRSYGETTALAGVSLELAPGEVFALVGPNGAGKTTLVRALTGTTDAEGTVRLFGTDPRDVDRDRIGLLPQSFDPPDRLTARELVAYYAGLFDDPRAVGSVLADVGLAEDADGYYETLSGGQRRRACVATALVGDPDLLVLDEPTTGIDPAGRRALWALLDGLAERGVTVLVTTHYMAEARELADRVGLLAGGELVACDDPEALIRAHGDEPRLTVTGVADTEGDGGLDATTAERVEAAVGRPTRVVDGRLVVRGVTPAGIGEVAAALERAGVDYDELAWSEPDLEDVYLELTGEPVRRDGVSAAGTGASSRAGETVGATTDGGRDASADPSEDPARGER